jgi:hypothetical protein
MVKIKPVNNTTSDTNRYCGPAVISAVTGMTTGEAARLIRHVSGQRKVTGSHTFHVLRALSLCNIHNRKMTVATRFSAPTLNQWLKGSKDMRTTGRVFLVVAGNHFQLVEGRRYVCGRTRDIVSVRSKYVKRRCRVETVHELINEGRIQIPNAARKPKTVDHAASNRAKAQRFAKELDVTISIERYYDYDNRFSQYWVDGYKDVDTKGEPMDFSHEGILDGHCAYDWGEVLEKLSAIEGYREEHGYNIKEDA